MTDLDVLDYKKNGYVLARNLFSPEEVKRMIQAVESGQRVDQHKRGSVDAEGQKSNLAIWWDIGDDIWGAVSTSPRIVSNVRTLIGEEVSFFHGKVMLKEAHTGGAWEWHQDYGYWYNGGYVFPHMISVFVALDPATIENGCLQVLEGSHRLGRLDHVKVGAQTGTDPERIEQIEGLFKRVHCEMEPGSALFFHCNLLHTSAPNKSDHDRRAFIMCYNAFSNPRVGRAANKVQTPCPVGSDDAILKAAV